MSRSICCQAILIAGLTVGWTSSAMAQSTQPANTDRSLTSEEAVAIALHNNPDFRVTRLSADQAAAKVRGAEGTFPWELQVDGGVTHTESPSLGPRQTVVTSTNDSVTLGSQLEKTFPTGTGLSFRVEGDRFSTRRPSSSLATGDTSISRGVGYDMTARATLTQPLLQGRGRRVNLADLRTARIARTQATRTLERTGSDLARDVEVTYWEAWFAGRAVELEQSALELANRQRREAEARRDQGALAPVDVLTFKSREAELRESVVAAEANHQRQLLSLQQLLGTETLPRLSSEPPPSVTIPTEATILQALEAESPELAELNERLRLAEANAEVTGENYRARLDYEWYVEARGLGNERLPPAAEQIATLNAVSSHMGLVYRTPLDKRRRDSARASADLDVSIAEANLVSARQRLRAQARSFITTVEAARASFAAAQETAAIAEQQFEAERLRFAAGATTPLEVQQAEDTLRQARHRVERARIDLVQAAVDLRHSMGALLERYAAEIAQKPESKR